MVLIYNGTSYIVDDISTSSEIYMTLPDIDAGIKAMVELRGMQSYSINGTQKQGMIVSKITLSHVRGGETRLYVSLRRPVGVERAQALEQTQAELNELRELVTPILQSRINATAVKNLQAAYPNLAAVTKEVE